LKFLLKGANSNVPLPNKKKALHFLFFAQALFKKGSLKKKKKKTNDTRDYIQYPVINQNGKKYEKEFIYIHI